MIIQPILNRSGRPLPLPVTATRVAGGARRSVRPVRRPAGYWTAAVLDAEVRGLAVGGYFPRPGELNRIGRGDVRNAIVRQGGFRAVAARVRMEYRPRG